MNIKTFSLYGAFLALFFLSVSQVYAAPQKGDQSVSVNGAFTSQDDNDNASFSASYGYWFTEYWEVGLSVNYTSSTSDSASLTGSGGSAVLTTTREETNNTGFGINTKYLFGKRESGSGFVTLEYLNFDGDSPGYDSWSYGIGYDFYVSDNTALSVGYTVMSNGDNDDGVEVEDSTRLSIGFAFYF